MRICSLKNLKAKNTDLDQYFQANSVSIDPLQLYDITGKQGWFIGNPAEFQLKKKIETNGKPLKDWDIKIYRGVLTGLNEAFIIDSAKRDQLIALDPKSAEIIKPILRGRDIKRYGYEWANLWIIGTFPALRLNIDDYPGIKKHLLDFGKDRLEQCGSTLADGTKSRKKTGNKWFETQDQIGYHAEFNKEKVVWTPVNSEYRFAILPSGFCLNNSLFMITGGYPKLFSALLNSKLIRKYLEFLFGSEENYTYGSKEVVETIPIPILDTTHKQELARQIEVIVEQILLVKSDKTPRQPLVATPQEGNFPSNTSELESQIDQLVYQLYDLTVNEIAVVEVN